LNKLSGAQKKVDEMQRNAEIEKNELEVKQAECIKVMNQISESYEKAAIKKQNCEKLEKELTTKQNEILSRKKKIEAELKDVKPLIEQAKQNVSNIKYQDMNEIKN